MSLFPLIALLLLPRIHCQDVIKSHDELQLSFVPHRSTGLEGRVGSLHRIAMTLRNGGPSGRFRVE